MTPPRNFGKLNAAFENGSSVQKVTRHMVIGIIMIVAALLTASMIWYYSKPVPQSASAAAKRAAAVAPVALAHDRDAAQREPENPSTSAPATMSPTSSRKISSYIPPSHDLPPLSTTYEQLKAAADAGDARAALDLHMGLERCNWPQSPDAKRTINRDYSAIPENPSPASRVMRRANVMQSDLAVLEHFEPVAQDCQAVPSELRERALEYLIRSADLGDAFAKTLYGQRGYPGESASATELLAYQDRARRYEDAAAITCTSDVVAQVAEGHRVGRFGDRPNPVLAYAYAAIVDQIASQPRQLLAPRYLSGLTSAQVQQAERHATEFIARNCQ